MKTINKHIDKTVDIKTIFFWLSLIIALGLIIDGSFIYAKAYLAKYLISDAWGQTLTGKRQVKPWPWADTWPVARLNVPGKSIHVFILSGANGASLPFGPGHITGTSLPGEPGESIIAAHRDTHFDFLEDISIGERFQVQTKKGSITKYKVIDISIADSRNQTLQTKPDSGYLSLITCYPFDAINPGGPLRYVVTAKKQTESSIRM